MHLTLFVWRQAASDAAGAMRRYETDDVTREVAKLRLAQIVLSFAVEDSRDAEPIKRAALNTMAVMSQTAIGTLPKGQPSIAGPSGDQGMR